jgi:hypothetical protein
VIRSREGAVTTLLVGRQRMPTSGMGGWWWIAKDNVGFMSISGLIGVVNGDYRGGPR